MKLRRQGNTHRKLIKVFGTGSKDRYAKVIDEVPQQAWITQGIAIVQDKSASCT